MDGVMYGGGNCNTCHDYDVTGASWDGTKWINGSWGKLPHRDGTTAEGWGAHAKHINHIKTRLGITGALTAAGQTFGSGQPANICGTCHSNLESAHEYSGTVRTINFGDGTYKYGGATGVSFLFDPAATTGLPATSPRPQYNGISGTSSSANAKSCSNIGCHFSTTPVWSAY
jgi:hypothetical protein